MGLSEKNSAKWRDLFWGKLSVGFCAISFGTLSNFYNNLNLQGEIEAIALKWHNRNSGGFLAHL
jgi:hypothetical protein